MTVAPQLVTAEAMAMATAAAAGQKGHIAAEWSPDARVASAPPGRVLLRGTPPQLKNAPAY